MCVCVCVCVCVSHRYLGYNALKDFFPTMEIKPNVSCVNKHCIELQKEAETRRNSPEALAAAREAAEAAARKEQEAAVHETNEWGIEVVSVTHTHIQTHTHTHIDTRTHARDPDGQAHVTYG